jgi:peptidoglycan-associated lipoprotein
MKIKNINILKVTGLLLVSLCLVGCNAKSNKTKQDNNISIEKDLIALNNEFKKEATDHVIFSFDNSELSRNACNILKKQAEWLRNNPKVFANIEGHCDETGTRKYNKSLGLKRAQSVKNFLINQGVDNHRLKIISYGKDRPEFFEHNKIADHFNRYVITVITE